MDLVDPPTCHGQPMRSIVYGMPDLEMVEASGRDDVELGGCCVSDDMRLFRCRVCGRTSGQVGDVDEHMADDDW